MSQAKGELGAKPRKFLTDLPGLEYARLEYEAAMRGTTGYKLAGQVLSDWLSNRHLPILLSPVPPIASPSHPSVVGQELPD